MEEKEKKNSKKKMWQIAFTINFTVVALAIIVALAMMDSDDSESTKSKTVATSTNAVEIENEVTKQNYIANSEKKTNEEKSQQTATKDNTTTATENTVKNSTNDNEKTYTTAQEIADGTTSYEKDTTTENTGNEDKFIPADVVIGKTFSKSDISSGMLNGSTDFVIYMALGGFDDIFPNWVFHSATIEETDGYGRYWVYVKYLKNSSDTTYSYEHQIIGINALTGNAKRYFTFGSADQQKRDAHWGSPLEF